MKRNREQVKNVHLFYIHTIVSSQDFNKKKPAQEKAMNDIVRDGQKLIDEDIVPTDKREAVEFDLQSLPETWNGIVAKADENKKTYVIVSIPDASIPLLLAFMTHQG